MHVKPSARTRTVTPNGGSHCHQLHVYLTLQFLWRRPRAHNRTTGELVLARSDARRTHLLEESKKQLHASLHEKDIKANDAFSTFDTDKNGTMDR